MHHNAHAFNFPAWIQIALAVVAGVGFGIGVIELILAIRWSPRRANERPRRGRPLRIIRFWRPSHYSLALGHLEDYCRRLKNGEYHTGNERGFVTQYDLVRWTFELALTCAAWMVPHSLGKANLFRVSQIITDSQQRRTEVRVYSSEFVGVFSASQLIDSLNGTRLRNLRLSPSNQNSDQYPAALQCAGEGMPIIQSLKGRKATFDEPEKALGATHILAIPLVQELSALNQPDQPASITVDLHFGRFSAWLIDHRDMQKMSVFRRAAQLSDILRDTPQLAAPMLLVPGDPDILRNRDKYFESSDEPDQDS